MVAEHQLTTSMLLRRPSAFMPMLMSVAACALVLGYVAVKGVAREPDEGTAAHLWQLLMVLQIPLIATFAVLWLPRAPHAAVRILALQAGLGLAALAPVFILQL